MKKKKKTNFRKTIFLLLILLLFCLCIKYVSLLIEYIFSNANNLSNISSNSDYAIIKQDINKDYSGIGQKKVKNKDGYFTTFTTIESNKKTYKEYKQNGNYSWSYKKYWGGTMEDNGCGITAIATILSGYNQNYTPEDLRQKYYPVLDNAKISEELYNTFKIKNTDFYYDSSHLSNKSLQTHLKTNRPVLICVWNKPEKNRWTTASHYMVLLATDENNMVYISNPNGLDNTSKSSGWYNINEVTPYIAKALYIESY
ncbi:MAG: hypothetical protein HFJ53_04865 [Clostridia bacterium]|jgi:hypothetical protein|nr:hypothetical protein [Clostridia bacterium]